MKASEVIQKLQSEIDLIGDTDIGVIYYLGEDSGGILRMKYSKDIRISVGYENTSDFKVTPKIDIHVNTITRNTKQI